MSSYEREELRREEFEYDNPPCRTHGIRGCDECEERYAGSDDDDDEVNYKAVVDTIHLLLSGQGWSNDTIEQIADVIESLGPEYRIADLDE